MLTNPLFPEFLLEAVGLHHEAIAGVVEPTLQRKPEIVGDAELLFEVDAGPRMIGCGERPAAAETMATGRQSNWALDRNMDGVRAELIHQPGEADARRHGDPDLGIAGHRHGRKPVGAEHLNLMANRAQLIHDSVEGADHAVDLRVPSVASDQDPHGTSAIAANARDAARYASL